MNSKTKEKIASIAKKIDLDLIIIFGSYAKKKNTSNSDLDVAYYSKKQINENELVWEIIKAIKIEKVDLIKIDINNSVELNWEIFKNSILIYEKTENLYEEFFAKAFINYIDFKENIKIKENILNKKLNSINTKNFKKTLSI